MRDLFDIDPSVINLNSGTLSITPRAVQAAVHKYIDEYNQVPALSLFKTWEKLWAVQKELADFLGASPLDVFIRENVTLSMNDFLMSAKLTAGSEVLIPDKEYGAIINICKLKCEREGLRFREFALPLSQDITVDQLVEVFKKQVSAKTSLLMFSHVLTGNGMKLPIQEISLELRKLFPSLLIAIDGAHGAGAGPLVLNHDCAFDFYGSNLHKWMMGPKGTGFGWVHPRAKEKLKPTWGSWTSFEIPTPFLGFGEGNRWVTQWMLSSTLNFASLFAIHDILQFWREHGAEKIFSTRRILLEKLMHEIPELVGWPCASPNDRALQGPMAAFRLPEKLADKNFQFMFDLFQKHKLLVAMTPINGKFHLRLAPSVYNTPAELDHAIRYLMPDSKA